MPLYISLSICLFYTIITLSNVLCHCNFLTWLQYARLFIMLVNWLINTVICIFYVGLRVPCTFFSKFHLNRSTRIENIVYEKLLWILAIPTHDFSLKDNFPSKWYTFQDRNYRYFEMSFFETTEHIWQVVDSFNLSSTRLSLPLFDCINIKY